jgi:peptidoglycan/xylan/chitin deacetylase (PgdA/CDA1 family)
MTYDKWLKKFVLFGLLTACLLILFNWATDPFGVFGDIFFNRYSYNMTNNPRTAKIAYIDKHHENYNSYVIGGSKSGALSPEILNSYIEGAKFYNMFFYGGDMYDMEKTALYLLKNYEVKNLVVNIGLEEGAFYNEESDPLKGINHCKVEGKSSLLFYGKHLFANPKYAFDKIVSVIRQGYLPDAQNVFVPETGLYDKRVRDRESIVDYDEYLRNNQGFRQDLGKASLSQIENFKKSLKAIKTACEEKNVNLIVIASPVYEKEIRMYDEEELTAFWEAIAEVTDFWDFSGYSPVSRDERYFYDAKHYRNSVGEMMCAVLFDDDSVYVPEGFGHYTKSDNVKERALEAFTPKEKPDPLEYTKKVPILMYHHLDEDESKIGSVTVTPEKFKKDMDALLKAGYETVFFSDLIAYVDQGKELPEKPIVITFDDGYESNYTYAYPVLRERNMKGVISVIGISVGKDRYKDTDYSMIPHFSGEQGREMVKAGVMEIQSHSFSMHDNEPYELPDVYREGVLPKKREREEEYIRIFKEDYLNNKALIEDQTGSKVTAYFYPFGKYTILTEALLREMGNRASVTVNPGINTLVKGLPQSLYGLKRIAVPASLDTNALLKLLEES